MATGHYRPVTLFWLRHWLIYLGPIGLATWLTWPAQSCSPPLEAALSHSVKDNYRAPQLPSSKMLLHVSNTNKPSTERWQTSRIKRKKKILQQIQCVLAHNILLIGVKMTIWREEAVTVKEGEEEEFLTLISFGTAALTVSINWQSCMPIDSKKFIQRQHTVHPWWTTYCIHKQRHVCIFGDSIFLGSRAINLKCLLLLCGDLTVYDAATGSTSLSHTEFSSMFILLCWESCNSSSHHSDLNNNHTVLWYRSDECN